LRQKIFQIDETERVFEVPKIPEHAGMAIIMQRWSLQRSAARHGLSLSEPGRNGVRYFPLLEWRRASPWLLFPGHLLQ